MPAQIIAVVNQKGGAGKTTVTMQLAGNLGRRQKVLVLDADRQGTATRWAAIAPGEFPFPAAVVALGREGDHVHQEARKYVDEYDLIIIDCPPAAESVVPQSALAIADLAIVPVKPSPLDLWASVGIREVIKEIQQQNTGLVAHLLVNQCQPNTAISKEVLDVLPEFGIPQMKTVIHLRTAYQQAAAYGGTVHDIPRSPLAVAEVDTLTAEVKRLLRR